MVFNQNSLDKMANDKLKLLTLEKIQKLLKESIDDGTYFESNDLNEPYQPTTARCAAVLIPLLNFNNTWHILFTRRTELVADHKGQVAFPGGACELIDSNLEATALRETHEEIGVNPKDIQILGRLREYVTVTGYIVAPIIGTFTFPYQFCLSEKEVDRVFTIPILWLIDHHNRETRKVSRRGLDIDVIYYKPYDNEILWGASARMVKSLLEILELT
jgi:8-oxo-dGTP pyrophosphatase MutT (NUDIX family)